LGAYQEGSVQFNYDIIASRQVWQLLKEGGTFYLSVPYGCKHLIVYPHWRIYDSTALKERLIQDFQVDVFTFFLSGNCVINGECRGIGDGVTIEEADGYCGTPPHVTAFLKLRKHTIPRISPNGR
jgi:hypothetical protein